MAPAGTGREHDRAGPQRHAALQLDLDEPISHYSSDFKDDSVKIKHLLTHTSNGTPGERYEYDGNRFDYLTAVIEKKTGIETRWVVLGHIQRGGSPSAYDRVLGTRLGVAAGRLVLEHKFGRMVALQGTRVIDVALADAVGKLKTLDPEFLRDAAEFFT